MRGGGDENAGGYTRALWLERPTPTVALQIYGARLDPSSAWQPPRHIDRRARSGRLIEGGAGRAGNTLAAWPQGEDASSQTWANRFLFRPRSGGEPRQRYARVVAHDAGMTRRHGGTLFLMTEAFRSHGGIQNYNRDRVQALLRCRADEPLSLLVLNDTADDVRAPEWRGLSAEGFARRRYAFARRVLTRGWKQQPERVLVGHRHLLPLAAALRVVAPRACTWLLTHGIEVERAFSAFERAALRARSRVFAVSPDTTRLVRAAGFDGRVELWPCSLPFDFPLPEPSPPRFAPPLRLLAVSRLAPPERRKGLDDVLRALARLRARGLDVRLDVAGEGEDLARLQALARDERVADVVAFHGRVTPAELQRLYAGCDVFVLPSAGEGFGIVYLEAMAHAKPVVAADAAGAPFVVRPGESGFLVPYGDPERLAAGLADLVARPDEARRIGRLGRRLLEREFTFDRLVERTREILADRP